MRLIDADELKKDIAENYVFTGFVELLNDFMEVINNAPTVDPVKHGRWKLVTDNRGQHFECPHCGEWKYHQGQRYCGN